MERKVKGTLVKSIVKGVRGDKTNKQKYDELLSDEAKELLNKRILDSIWYPFDAYFELYFALAKYFAKNKSQIFIKWGNEFGKVGMSTIYKNIVAEGNLDKLVEKFHRFHKLLFNFGDLILEKISNNEILITYNDFETDFEFWYYTAAGWIQKSVEMCIKKRVKFDFLKKSWEGDDHTEIKLFWDA